MWPQSAQIAEITKSKYLSDRSAFSIVRAIWAAYIGRSMRSGGESGKFGNAYEESWTVHNLLQVIDDRARDLEPEPMNDGLGVEFIKTKVDGVREFHSAKVQTSGPYWSVTDLGRANPKGRSIVG